MRKGMIIGSVIALMTVACATQQQRLESLNPSNLEKLTTINQYHSVQLHPTYKYGYGAGSFRYGDLSDQVMIEASYQEKNGIPGYQVDENLSISVVFDGNRYRFQDGKCSKWENREDKYISQDEATIALDKALEVLRYKNPFRHSF